MKTRKIILIGILATMMSGCLVKSLHSFYDEGDVIYKPELTGKWLVDDSSQWVIIRKYLPKGLFKPNVCFDKPVTRINYSSNYVSSQIRKIVKKSYFAGFICRTDQPFVSK